jgi:hypothetical protein
MVPELVEASGGYQRPCTGQAAQAHERNRR